MRSKIVVGANADDYEAMMKKIKADVEKTEKVEDKKNVKDKSKPEDKKNEEKKIEEPKSEDKK